MLNSADIVTGVDGGSIEGSVKRDVEEAIEPLDRAHAAGASGVVGDAVLVGDVRAKTAAVDEVLVAAGANQGG